jgi:hypothetical protein
MEPVVARKMWRTMEPYHGLIYFAPEATAAYAELGIHGFDGYFASRAAAMGPVPAEVVVATFFNFEPGVVHHAIPAAWAAATPTQILAARLDAVRAALRRAVGDLLDGADVARAVDLIRPAAAACTPPGRPLYAAHAALPWPDEPALALWHAVTLLREFRGDGHVACLVEAGLSGIDALVLHAASGEVPRVALQRTRQWSDDAWAAAVEGLADRGVVDGDGAFTDAGASLRGTIEDKTDELAMAPWEAIGAEACDELRALVRPLSRAVVSNGGLPGTGAATAP